MNFLEWRDELKAGRAVTRKVHGDSMSPRINDGDTVTIEPVTDMSTIVKGDIVFCKVRGNFYVHLVKSIKFYRQDGVYRFLIANNHGHENGWANQVYGRVRMD